MCRFTINTRTHLSAGTASVHVDVEGGRLASVLEAGKATSKSRRCVGKLFPMEHDG